MRRRLVTVIVATATAGIGAIAALLVPGQVHEVSSPYSVTWNEHAQNVGGCVQLQASGTVRATARTSLLGRTSWSGTRIDDPTIAATLLPLAGTCTGVGEPRRARARLVQSWRLPDGAAPSAPERATDEGPAAEPLRQFNSGAPIRIEGGADGASLSVSGTITAVMRTATTSQEIRRTVEVVLHR